MSQFPYEDIINLPPHISKKYPQASMEDRAARFSPFAAITGYEDMVKEAARTTDDKIELDESSQRVLDDKLIEIRRRLTTGDTEALCVTINHFVEDSKKSGGAYIDTIGTIKRVDDYQHALKLTSGELIYLENIYSILFSPVS